jgi:membrane associated rhomboid family serine protease
MQPTDVQLNELALLGPDEAQAWKQRLRRTARPCGCKSGAAAMLAALVIWPVHMILSGVPTAPLSVLAAVMTYVAVVIGAAVGGKVAGIVAGRLRHRRLQRHLARRLVDLQTAR